MTGDLPPGAVTLEGVVETETFAIAAGETVYVTGDLVLRASETIEIAGELIAADDGGQSIELEAQGDVMVDGVVRAGNGGTEQAGGSLTLTSLGGDVVLGAASRIEAGNGSTGVIDFERDTTGRGFDGGDVAVNAPAGTLSVGDGAVIHIGNGGAGADVAIRAEDAPTDIPVWVMQNGGGASGGFAIDASTLDGLETEQATAGEDIIDDDGDVAIATGEQYLTITAVDHFEGGIGGEAGGFEMGPDVPESHYTRAALSGASEKRHVVTIYDREVRGVEGAAGALWPGAGQSVSIVGYLVRASLDGQSVSAEGGFGGRCSEPLTRSLCTPGDGGGAIAEGSDAAAGPPPSGTGGHGGAGRAVAGRASVATDTLGTAICGSALASGGRGGDGGGDCLQPETLGDVGGAGGDGGNALAIGCEPGRSGPVDAYAGSGGYGGDGRAAPGSGGYTGIPMATNGNEVAGVDGVEGGRCTTSAAHYAHGVLGRIQPQVRSGDSFVDAGAESIGVDLINADQGVEGIFVFDEESGVVTFISEGVEEFTTRPDSPSPVTIGTSTQSITATVDEGVYSFTGADASDPAFSDGDTVVWNIENEAHDPVNVPAPDGWPVVTAGSELGDVVVNVEEHESGWVYMEGELTGSELPGASGFTMLIDMTAVAEEDGEWEVAPFSADFLEELDNRGLEVSGSLLIGAAELVYDETFWPDAEPVPFMAVNFVSIPLLQLVPPPPGEDVAVACEDLPAEIPHPDPEDGTFRGYAVCFDDADACRVTNDVFRDEPPADTQCGEDEQAVRFFVDGGLSGCAQVGWDLVWSSGGLGSGTCGPISEAGVTEWMTFERESDGERHTVTYTADTASATFDVEAGASEAFAPFGAQHHCEGMPAEFATASDANYYATFCVGDPNQPCTVMGGDQATTPETELSCGVPPILRLYELDDFLMARNAAPTDTVWTVESASHGTILGTPAARVEQFPADTDVTVVMTNGTDDWEFVFRFVSADSAYVVESIEQL